MRFQRIHEAVNFQPWFISAAGYASVKSLVDRAMSQPIARNEGLDDFFSDFVRQRPAMTFDDHTKRATIYVFGVVGPYLSNIEKACGNTGYEEIQSEIADACDKGAQRIDFIFDSPGGAVTLCDETAQAIASLKEQGIVTVAFTETQMCSAAYYLASGCDVIIATRSSQVGNIGVICPWVDSSMLWAIEGLDFQPITSEGADLKSTMHGPSITEDQRQFLQESIDSIGTMFRDHVKAGRAGRDLSDEVWRAGWYGGDDAKLLGLVDIVGNSPDAL
jgi:ClpP class serine protease